MNTALETTLPRSQSAFRDPQNQTRQPPPQLDLEYEVEYDDLEYADV